MEAQCLDCQLLQLLLNVHTDTASTVIVIDECLAADSESSDDDNTCSVNVNMTQQQQQLTVKSVLKSELQQAC